MAEENSLQKKREEKKQKKQKKRKKDNNVTLPKATKMVSRKREMAQAKASYEGFFSVLGAVLIIKCVGVSVSAQGVNTASTYIGDV